MKKVIEGALYNTETAKTVGSWVNGLSRRDFNNCSETLYRTKAGKYFLHGEGGPMSKYAESTGNNSWSGGEHLEPLSPSAAASWAQEKLSADQFSAEFGEPAEASEDTEVLICTIPKDLKTKLRRMGSDQGRPMGAIVADLIAAAPAKAAFQRCGRWWNDNGIELVKIDGTVYALNGWNGEAFEDCWTVTGKTLTDVGVSAIRICPEQIETEEDVFEIVGYTIL